MRELILVGASGLARETLAPLSVSGSHRVIGVVDDGAVVGVVDRAAVMAALVEES